MILLADIVSDDEDAAAEAASHVVRIANARDGEGFVAVTPEQRKRFWLDRARTAAISRHTNAFKINEDVVIPLERLGDYTDGIERINIEFSIGNKLELCRRLEAFFAGDMPVWGAEEARDRARRTDLLGDRPARALELAREVAARWQLHPRSPGRSRRVRGRAAAPHAHLVEGGAARAAARHLLRARLRAGDEGDRGDPRRGAARARLRGAAHARRRRQRAHQHPGELRRLRDAAPGQRGGGAHHEVRARPRRGDLRASTASASRSSSSWSPPRSRRSSTYKKRVDPEGRFNRGKLLPGADLRNAYTPSFALIGHESLILEQNDIGAIADMFKDCLRCGKCKPVCTTHVPRANLLYSPRNKILATSLLTEAFLYEEQTRRGVSIRHFDEYGDVADHCTVCHKCLAPCPVDIDFGDVSIAMRNLLAKLRKRRFNLGTWASLQFLNAQDPARIKAIKAVMIDVGYRVQRAANKLWGRTPFVQRQTRKPPETVGRPALTSQVIHFINKPMPGGCRRRPRARSSTWRTRPWCRSSAIPRR